jgi:hypothetical protein
LTRTLYMSVPLCRWGAIVTVLQSVKSPSTAVLESAKRLIDRVLSAGWVSYLLIAALQLKVIWAIWRLRDLTYGDESRYFLSAYQWANELLTNPIWSPLYTAYYGTIYWLLGEDVYAAAIMHRAIIVMLVALGVLAVLRMLLPPALALLIAAWWAILPTNFDVLYTVHLFSFVPVLAAAIIAGSGDTPWFRGSALAILLIACLARLELVVAVFAYAIICLWRETHELRSGRSNMSWHQRATAYGIPLGFALAVYGIFLWRSSILLQDFTQNFYSRLTLNMCQAYSVSWHQMHHSDAGYACRSVMQTTFGQSDLTFPQMISFNSIATVQYLLWNLSLVPSGLQLALFNHTIGTKNPDFVRPDHLGSPLGLVLGIVCILVLLAGGISIWRQWKDWGANWFRSRQGLWLMLLALTCASIPIFLAIRPRPAYFYPTTLTLMAIIGTAVYALTRSRLQPYVNALALIFVGILILAVPPATSPALAYRGDASGEAPLYIGPQFGI